MGQDTADRPDHDATRTVAFHPEQGWSLLCNGVIVFDDMGEILPDGRVVPPYPGPRPAALRGVSNARGSCRCAGSGSATPPASSAGRNLAIAQASQVRQVNGPAVSEVSMANQLVVAGSATALPVGLDLPCAEAPASCFLRRIYSSRIGRAFMATPQKGASQMVWLAETTPGTDWQSGTYYEKHKPARRNNPQALDPDLARQLWDRSAELLGQRVR